MRGHPVTTLIALLAFAAVPATAEAQKIDIQMRFPPLTQVDAPPGGAHPVGGVSNAFVNLANEFLKTEGIEFIPHITGANISPEDEDDVLPRLFSLGELGGSLAQGVANGQLIAALDIPINNGHPWGELFVAGLPFGFEPDEYMTYLYEGGGLELQQELYDEVFDGKVVVMPFAITSAQGAGWFPQPLPDPDNNDDLSGVEAMQELCGTSMIVRWAEPGGGVWRQACDNVGVPATLLGSALEQSTRCADFTQVCTPDDPTFIEIEGLTFGGFTPGVLPQIMLNTANIDAHEFNLPSADVQFNKRALGLRNEPNRDANGDAIDISEVVTKAPFQYAGSWHQPLSYMELLINRDFWDELSPGKRNAIEAAAKSSVLFNLTARLNAQGDAMAILQENGAIRATWPQGLLEVLRTAADDFFDPVSGTRLDQIGDPDERARYARVVNDMREFIALQQSYNDFGDVNQGQAGLPTSP